MQVAGQWDTFRQFGDSLYNMPVKGTAPDTTKKALAYSHKDW
jgi:hypothetical protein